MTAWVALAASSSVWSQVGPVPAQPNQREPVQVPPDQPASLVPPELRLRVMPKGSGLSMSDNAAGAGLLPPNETLRAVEVSEATQRIIGELDAAGYAERRAASEQLLSVAVPLDELLSALARGGMSIEQQHRLLAITFDRIVNAPRGALGIQMGRSGAIGPPNAPGAAINPRSEGVRVTRVIPGFPAEKHIMVDDVIVAIDGKAMRDTEDLRKLVQGMPPGTTVRVEALRADRDARGKPKLDGQGNPITKRIEVSFPLGSKRELDATEPAQMAFGSDPLDQARQEFGRSVLRRFMPPTINAKAPDDAVVGASFANRDTNSYDIVAQLGRELADARVQQRAIEPQKLAWFRSQLKAVRTMSEDPSYSDAERDWYERVAARLEDLIKQASPN